MREQAKLRKVLDRMIDTAVIEDKDDKDQIDVNAMADDMMQVVENLEDEAADETDDSES